MEGTEIKMTDLKFKPVEAAGTVFWSAPEQDL